MKYTESEMMETLRRVSKMYLESYPEDRDELERFLRWVHSQYGYVFKD